ncbi:MAG: hypothetical protein FJ011_18410 [Chloroflexi bacterium]|nr:hypothetical protein [Chloroflexota bacterium]
MPTQPSPAWSHLKPHLQRLDHAALLALLRDLDALIADNKVFPSTRFLAAAPEELAAPYRRIVKQVFNPEHGMPGLQLDAPARSGPFSCRCRAVETAATLAA